MSSSMKRTTVSRAISTKNTLPARRKAILQEGALDDGTSMHPWENLNEWYRESNRSVAAHFDVKLRAIGWERYLHGRSRQIRAPGLRRFLTRKSNRWQRWSTAAGWPSTFWVGGGKASRGTTPGGFILPSDLTRISRNRKSKRTETPYWISRNSWRRRVSRCVKQSTRVETGLPENASCTDPASAP